MSAVLVNIVTGLVATIISGTAVWLWQRGSRARMLRRKAVFFGLRSGQGCLVFMNRHWRSPDAVASSDVHALLGIASLADELGCAISVQSSNELREGVGDQAEFCIGGPDSNTRTAAHLTSFLPGVMFKPYSMVREFVEIVVGDKRFVREPNKLEYAFVAKFTPSNTANPVFLICGQTPIANHAAIHFLRRHYRALAKTVPSIERFGLIVRVTSPEVYGHQMVDVEEDVTKAAFAGRIVSA